MKKSILTIVIITFAVAGCASFTGNAYKTLSTSATVYESSMSAAGDAYKQGLLNDADKAKILKIADKYWAAYHAAVIALEVYERTKSSDARSKVEAALVEVSRAYGELLEIIRRCWEVGRGYRAKQGPGYALTNYAVARGTKWKQR